MGWPRGGTRSENCWGCAVGHWKLDPKRSRGKWYFGAKKIEFCEDLYPKDRFCVGGWEKTPQKDRVWYPEAQKIGSKPRHICITHHIGSTPPGVMTMCLGKLWINSLSPGKFQRNVRWVIFKLILVINGWVISCEIVLRWILLDHSSNGLVPSGQCWPRSMLPYGVTRPQWVNWFVHSSGNWRRWR